MVRLVEPASLPHKRCVKHSTGLGHRGGSTRPPVRAFRNTATVANLKHAVGRRESSL